MINKLINYIKSKFNKLIIKEVYFQTSVKNKRKKIK